MRCLRRVQTYSWTENLLRNDLKMGHASLITHRRIEQSSINLAKASAWLIFKGHSNWCLRCAMSSELRRFICNSFKNLKFTSWNRSVRLSLGPSDALFIYFFHSDRTEKESWKKVWLIHPRTFMNSSHKSYAIEHNLANATYAIALKHNSQNSEWTFWWTRSSILSLPVSLDFFARQYAGLRILHCSSGFSPDASTKRRGKARGGLCCRILFPELWACSSPTALILPSASFQARHNGNTAATHSCPEKCLWIF